jgi:nucleoside-diphosphate-sugar epimerase
MNVLVTGGGGFLGGAIVRRLAARGDQVRAFQRGHYPELAMLGVECVQGDVADFAAVRNACAGCELVCHVAAKAGVWGPRDDFFRANVTGTENVLRACREVGVRRLVYTSSPSVVFDGTDMEGVNEAAPYPQHFEADYPESKAIAEMKVLHANSPELATVSLRPHLIWGPGDPHLVPRILARARAGQLRRIGRADKKVDSVYIDNAADAHVLAADKLAPASPIAGKVYFITNGEPLPLWELINKILACAGLPPVTRTISPRLAYFAGSVLETTHRWLGLKSEPRLTRFLARELATAHWFDISAARRDLGYEPKVSIAAGLEQLKQSFTSNRL